MVMTIEQKTKCTDIYEAYTELYVEPYRWNEVAANYLAKFIYEVAQCSRGMGAIKAIFPSTTKITWTYLVKIPVNLYRSERKVSKGWRNTNCINAKLMGGHKRRIESAILLGK